MPIYDDEEVKDSYSVTFPSGAVLTIKLKPEFDSATYVRQFIARSRAATALEEKIQELEKKQRTAPTADFEKIQKEIDSLQSMPDQLAVLTDVIFMTGEGWDRYANKEAKERGEPVPFTKEKIAGMGLGKLNLIVNELMQAMGIAEVAADPKAQSSKSNTPSSQASTAP